MKTLIATGYILMGVIIGWLMYPYIHKEKACPFTHACRLKHVFDSTSVPPKTIFDDDCGFNYPKNLYVIQKHKETGKCIVRCILYNYDGSAVIGMYPVYRDVDIYGNPASPRADLYNTEPPYTFDDTCKAKAFIKEFMKVRNQTTPNFSDFK